MSIVLDNMGREAICDEYALGFLVAGRFSMLNNHAKHVQSPFQSCEEESLLGIHNFPTPFGISNQGWTLE